MKKLVFILFIITASVLVSCEGPMGPMGPEGPAGGEIIGTTFEFTDNFTAANGYEVVFNFRDNGFDPYESDVILTYMLWQTESGLDYWRPLPQSVYFNSGAILVYNFDFTADIPNDRIVDMAVFLDGDVDFSTLSSDYTRNQTFRVVVVPSDFLSKANVDVSDLNSILNSPEIQMKSLGKIDLNTSIDTSLEIK
ncbi:hypothetical protein OU798_09730 [Prolixibacteraceae bacterium Z1-6]|uniref:Collagen-like protein n=1 Tax=Draconibacterium aestuarii TaxID=2998507 RepID=A0A9X3F6E0_9BACT|nr:hypothetical protein [Prolixibacteraceae bacterium Z1-6]